MANSLTEVLQAALQGRYLLDRELGRGGMGVVYLARDVGLDRLVAIKLLPPHLAAGPGVRSRFLREARTAARLSHPHIVPIHAVEEHGDLVCFIMAYVAGETVAERVHNSGPLTPSAVTRLVQEIAWALAYAHQHGVVHRDVKPENILLERGTNRAMVTDFGIARLDEAVEATPPGDVMGTPRLVSPEQAAGEPVDGRSDLYSLGVTAFFALTGRYPFEGDSAGQLLAQHLTVPAPPVASARPGIPRPLATAIDRCLAKSPAERFPSGEDLAAAVAEGTTGAPTPRVLQQLVHEISSMAVDIVSFGTLVLVAVLAQVLTVDFLGRGFVYTVALAAVLVSVTAIRGIHLTRLTREAAKEGWDQSDLVAAAERDAAEANAAAGPPPSLGRRFLLFGAGLGALLWYWLGPKQWGLEQADTVLGLVIEILGLVGPVALGRWLGAALEAPREGRPGMLSRFFLRFKAGLFFRLFSRTDRTPPPALPLADQPTEMLLASQARDLLRALPAVERERLAGAEDILRGLEGDAALLRVRLRELDEAAAVVGGTVTAERREVAAGIADARRAAVERLGATVSALETLRLDLLRARAGLPGTGNLTENLAALRKLSDRVDASLEANET
jgi:serine/threonine-protein kinase